MAITSIERAFCNLQYAPRQSNKTLQCAFIRKFNEKAPAAAAQIWKRHINFNMEACFRGAKDLNDQYLVKSFTKSTYF